MREHHDEIEREAAEEAQYRRELEAGSVAQYASVGTKGQVVIPVQMRRKLGIKPGQRVRIEIEEGRVTLRPVPANILDLWHGRYADSPNDLLADLRRDHEEEIAHDERRNLRRARPAGLGPGRTGS